jgi:hypothetical protein
MGCRCAAGHNLEEEPQGGQMKRGVALDEELDRVIEVKLSERPREGVGCVNYKLRETKKRGCCLS